MIGTVGSEFEYSHSAGTEKFNTFRLNIQRDSGYIDSLSMVISEKVTYGLNISMGTRVEINGQYRSFTKHLPNDENDKKKRETQLFIFVTSIKVLDSDSDKDISDTNEVKLIGEVWKCFRHRHTKSGRDVVDFILRVAREYGRYDYLDCIAWGRDAIYLDKITEQLYLDKEPRLKVSIDGRMQSREFTKYNSDGSSTHKEIFELSVVNLNTIEEDDTDENKD